MSSGQLYSSILYAFSVQTFPNYSFVWLSTFFIVFCSAYSFFWVVEVVFFFVSLNAMKLRRFLSSFFWRSLFHVSSVIPSKQYFESDALLN